jgi:hypothetical protein
MFFPSLNAILNPAVKSVTEYMEEHKKPEPIKSVEPDTEFAEMDAEVMVVTNNKRAELSFEIVDEMINYP